MRGQLESSASLHPNLAEFFIYGQSWEKTSTQGQQGHDLFGVKLTNRSKPGPKPVFFLMAAIHARELTTSEIAMRLVDHLLDNYGADGGATWLLDEHQIVVVPVVNPDGRVVAERGFLQRKNTNHTSGGTCSNPPSSGNQFGVDLNRNYAFQWGVVNAPTEPPCGQTYPGPQTGFGA
jgi:murein tripeptide amidase MpaA